MSPLHSHYQAKIWRHTFSQTHANGVKKTVVTFTASRGTDIPGSFYDPTCKGFSHTAMPIWALFPNGIIEERGRVFEKIVFDLQNYSLVEADMNSLVGTGVVRICRPEDATGWMEVISRANRPAGVGQRVSAIVPMGTQWGVFSTDGLACMHIEGRVASIDADGVWIERITTPASGVGLVVQVRCYKPEWCWGY